MVCSDFASNFAVTLQCLGKTIYSGKQRNIYEHIYRIYSPIYCKPPTYIEHTVA